MEIWKANIVAFTCLYIERNLRDHVISNKLRNGSLCDAGITGNPTLQFLHFFTSRKIPVIKLKWKKIRKQIEQHLLRTK